MDPLRMASDPLEDPSQLFAFVTKTTSPVKDKVRSLLIQDDNHGLFSNIASSKNSDDTAIPKSNSPKMDLFEDHEDSGDDLFSTASMKRAKNAVKVSVFEDKDDDDDDDGNLWLSSKKEEQPKSKVQSKTPEEDLKSQNDEKKKSIFEDDDEEEPFLFGKDDKAQSKFTAKSKNLEDIFNDRFSDDDDLFGEKSQKTSLFEKNEGKSVTGEKEETKVLAEKKSATKDLKKIAKQVTTNDPLSLLGDE